jgi:transaldolase
VASFFLSRIDTLADSMLEKIMAQGGKKTDIAKQARGQTAIASAKTAYQIYREIFNNESFRKLGNKGARTQRVLWASTGTKNPEYSDIKYIEAVIGSDTINTIPVDTMNAYRDHGDPKPRLEQDAAKAGRILEQLSGLGINIDRVTQQLEDEGVDKFNKPFDKIMEILGQKTGRNLTGKS